MKRNLLLLIAGAALLAGCGVVEVQPAATHASATGALVTASDAQISRTSPYSVDQTVARLVDAIEAKGATVFARIDHGAAAAKVGLDLPPTVLVIFGNPALGTPLMQSARTIAIDLPLKALVYETEGGVVTLLMERPQAIAARHGITDQDALLARIEAALLSFADAATR